MKIDENHKKSVTSCKKIEKDDIIQKYVAFWNTLCFWTLQLLEIISLEMCVLPGLYNFWTLQFLDIAVSGHCTFWRLYFLHIAISEHCSFWTLQLLDITGLEMSVFPGLCNFWTLQFLDIATAGDNKPGDVCISWTLQFLDIAISGHCSFWRL